MKTKINILLLFAIIELIGISSCKKYEEGPVLSLRFKNARVAGVWTYDKVTVSGNDFTSLYANEKVEFTKDGKAKWTYSSALSKDGEWKFNDDKSKLMTKFDNVSTWIEYEIIKLRNDQLWLKKTEGNSITEYQLGSK
ncbi:MAG: hypothetical protein A2275_00060 [Bacteroidetes bacterium RIFOXYA12_FULL_35_11]|nr:MAG: hypothetical protein A2X01_06770 [Bacteroidetes bacterium GWF2_35_48]OFY81143.1 MAG: hypothetical protein A2275_00060 [Bacteroidetes bacterium RIFOXYA12_FULL_35_11]OFY98942.1 MAG: hypothetical protein A2491_12325 [Bacteroidetes bacterium RIFOXYC12_FULL_35_7]HBX49771.1 hypothetical protein [Bacteroidales bacterium]